MAIFRKIHTTIWSDSFFSELDKDKKLFYLYLLTNERTKQCGVYEITKKQISFDLSYSIDRVSKLIKYFISKGKIMYNDKTKEVALGNWLKYNSSTSPKVQKCINKEFNLVKDTVLIEYAKGMYTASQQEEEQEEEETQEEEQIEIPSEAEFMIYIKDYLKKEPDRYLKARTKLMDTYNAWVVNDWKDGNDKKIKNWKTKALMQLRYIK